MYIVICEKIWRIIQEGVLYFINRVAQILSLVFLELNAHMALLT